MYLAILTEVLATFFFFAIILVAAPSPIAIGAGLAVAVWFAQAGSAAHLNPAVSLMMYVKKDIDMIQLISYVSAQIAGAMLALLWWRGVVGNKKRSII